jgi:hypothetical protein
MFGERLISRGIWPPRSPDLSPPDVFLWGAAKSQVHEINAESVAELRTATNNYVQSITDETFLIQGVSKIQDMNSGMSSSHVDNQNSLCEISSSHGGEYDVQSCLLGCTAV